MYWKRGLLLLLPSLVLCIFHVLPWWTFGLSAMAYVWIGLFLFWLAPQTKAVDGTEKGWNEYLSEFGFVQEFQKWCNNLDRKRVRRVKWVFLSLAGYILLCALLGPAFFLFSLAAIMVVGLAWLLYTM